MQLASGETIDGLARRDLLGHADAALRAAASASIGRREAASASKDYRYGKGDMQIHYALKSPPRWKTPELGNVALLHLTPGLDGVSKAVNECERGMLPAVPTICVGQPHALDPSRCPPGAGILWIQLPEAPRTIKGDAAGEIATPADGRWTEAIREAYADRVESDHRKPHRRLSRERRRAARLFARRPRGDEHQPRRRRSLWRLLAPSTSPSSGGRSRTP